MQNELRIYTTDEETYAKTSISLKLIVKYAGLSYEEAGTLNFEIEFAEPIITLTSINSTLEIEENES